MGTHPFGLGGYPVTGLPRIRGGHWYRTSGGVINAAILGLNKMTLQAFWPAYRGTLDGIAYENTVQAVHASGTEILRFGLYADDGEGRPTGAALFQTASLDMEGSDGTVGIHAVSTSWTGIKPQLYWLACNRFTTGTVSTSSRQRLAANDDMKDYMQSDANATPAATFMGASPICNYEMATTTAALPTIASLTIGTFVQTCLICVKFT